MSNHASSSKHNNKRTVKQKRASSPPPPQPPPQSPSEPDEPPVSEGSQTPSYTSGSIDERNALGLTEQQLILHDLQLGLMDPITFARTPLSHITEQSERSKTISAGARSNQEERYADYAPTKPPSFLASSSGSDRTPISPRGGAGGRNFGNESFKYASRLDEFSSPEPVPRPGTTGDGSDGSSLYSPGVRDGNKTPSSAGSFVQSGQNVSVGQNRPFFDPLLQPFIDTSKNFNSPSEQATSGSSTSTRPRHTAGSAPKPPFYQRNSSCGGSKKRLGVGSSL